MPPRRKVGGSNKRKAVGGRKRKVGGRKMLAGAGFFSSIGNAFKSAGNAIASGATKGFNWAKDRAVDAAPGLVKPLAGKIIRNVVPGGDIVAPVLGLGRRKRGGARNMAGRGSMTNENVKVLAF